MTTVADILNFVETLAPRAMKMDWDNVGLLCGSKRTPVTRVLVALDPFEHVCAEAARWPSGGLGADVFKGVQRHQDPGHGRALAAAEQAHVVPVHLHGPGGQGLHKVQNIGNGRHHHTSVRKFRLGSAARASR